jgi:hypothetical protein
VVGLALALSSSCSSFVAPGTAVRAQSRVAATPAVAMGSDQVTSRRAMLASFVLAVPAAANAMVPGLNGPGLVPAKKVPKSTSTGFGRDFENIRDKSNFWSSQGVRRTPAAYPPPLLRRTTPFSAHAFVLGPTCTCMPLLLAPPLPPPQSPPNAPCVTKPGPPMADYGLGAQDEGHHHAEDGWFQDQVGWRARRV